MSRLWQGADLGWKLRYFSGEQTAPAPQLGIK